MSKKSQDIYIYIYITLVKKTPDKNLLVSQRRSQNAEKVTHTKGRLLDQAVILFNCVPFHNENFSERKEFAPRGSGFFPSRAVPYGMENHFYHIRLPPLNVSF